MADQNASLTWIITLIALVAGLILGRVLVFALTLLSEQYWYLGVGLLIVLAGVVLYETVMQRTLAGIAQRRFSLSDDEAAIAGRRLAHVARYAAAAGVAIVLLLWAGGAF